MLDHYATCVFGLINFIIAPNAAILYIIFRFPSLFHLQTINHKLWEYTLFIDKTKYVID